MLQNFFLVKELFPFLIVVKLYVIEIQKRHYICRRFYL